METYYHGTVSSFVPSILKNGLKPEPTHAWNIDIPGFFGIYNPSIEDDPGYVYISSDVKRAKIYADVKADYFRAKNGDTFAFKMFSSEPKLEKKTGTPYLPDATPVLLRIKAANTLRLERDPHDWSAMRVHGVIPPELIEVVK